MPLVQAVSWTMADPSIRPSVEGQAENDDMARGARSHSKRSATKTRLDRIDEALREEAVDVMIVGTGLAESLLAAYVQFAPHASQRVMPLV